MLLYSNSTMKGWVYIVAMVFATGLWADELVKNDGSKIKGKVLKVTESTIELDPDGDIPFVIVPRKNINKIIYNNGIIVDLKEAREIEQQNREQNNSLKAENGQQTQTINNWYLATEIGWNGYVGLGGRFDWQFMPHFSLNAGLGFARLWYWRASLALRFYLKYPYGFAISTGLAYNGGFQGFETNSETVDNAGNVSEQQVRYDLHPVTTYNTSILYAWKMGRHNKLYVELGYSFRLRQDTYTLISQHTLTDTEKNFMNFMAPGGALLSLGYSFAI